MKESARSTGVIGKRRQRRYSNIYRRVVFAFTADNAYERTGLDTYDRDLSRIVAFERELLTTVY